MHAPEILLLDPLGPNNVGELRDDGFQRARGFDAPLRFCGSYIEESTAIPRSPVTSQTSGFHGFGTDTIPAATLPTIAKMTATTAGQPQNISHSTPLMSIAGRNGPLSMQGVATCEGTRSSSY